MSTYTGFKLELTTPKGVEFKCSYAKKDVGLLLQAVSTFVRREGGYFILSISPGDAPRPASTMEEWIAAGNTTD